MDKLTKDRLSQMNIGFRKSIIEGSIKMWKQQKEKHPDDLELIKKADANIALEELNMEELKKEYPEYFI